jgi:hypothetical protein
MTAPLFAEIPNTNQIVQYLHCGLCLAELREPSPSWPPEGSGESEEAWAAARIARDLASPKLYARLEVGFTPIGLQIWCARHDVNVVHIDFEGQQHPANVSRRADA